MKEHKRRPGTVYELRLKPTAVAQLKPLVKNLKKVRALLKENARLLSKLPDRPFEIVHRPLDVSERVAADLEE